MAKKNDKETKKEADVLKETKASKGYTVLDSNGKKFRVVEDKSEAESLAAQIGGRLAK
jgi:hypothetical protein